MLTKIQLHYREDTLNWNHLITDCEVALLVNLRIALSTGSLRQALYAETIKIWIAKSLSELIVSSMERNFTSDTINGIAFFTT